MPPWPCSSSGRARCPMLDGSQCVLLNHGREAWLGGRPCGRPPALAVDQQRGRDADDIEGSGRGTRRIERAAEMRQPGFVEDGADEVSWSGSAAKAPPVLSKDDGAAALHPSRVECRCKTGIPGMETSRPSIPSPATGSAVGDDHRPWNECPSGRERQGAARKGGLRLRRGRRAWVGMDPGRSRGRPAAAPTGEPGQSDRTRQEAPPVPEALRR